jgi:hypothetical protein
LHDFDVSLEAPFPELPALLPKRAAELRENVRTKLRAVLAAY